MRERYKSHDLYIVHLVKDFTQVTRDRGSGGLATIWKKSLTKYVTKVDSNNPRIQATKFQLPECPMLVINSYFPCDPQIANSDLEELLILLSDIEKIIRDNAEVNIMLVGDFNCHFERQTRFTTCVQNWLMETNLISLWSHEDPRIEEVDFTFSKILNDAMVYSTIDHFALSDRMLNGLKSAGVIHDGSNLSQH